MPEMDGQDTTRAIEAASKALATWRLEPPRKRARVLRALFDQMTQHTEDLATLITAENGKSMTDARGEVTYAASFLEWFSEEAPRIYGDTISSSTPTNRIWTIKEPIGVCGLITP